MRQQDLEDELSVLLHDLNNSLQPILIFSELGIDFSEKKSLDPQILSFFQKIIQSATMAREQLHALVDKLDLEKPVPDPFPKRPPGSPNFIQPRRPWEALKQKEIWVVDDDEESLQALAEVLLIQEIYPKTFLSKKDVLSELEHHSPDLIISDMRLQEGTGKDLIESVWLKKKDALAIVISGYWEGNEKESMESLGILVRQKPVSVSELQESILLAFGLL